MSALLTFPDLNWPPRSLSSSNSSWWNCCWDHFTPWQPQPFGALSLLVTRKPAGLWRPYFPRDTLVAAIFDLRSTHLIFWRTGLGEGPLLCPHSWKHRRLLWGSSLASQPIPLLLLSPPDSQSFPSFANDWLLTQSIALYANDCHSQWQHCKWPILFSGFPAAWFSKLQRSSSLICLKHSLSMSQPELCPHQQLHHFWNFYFGHLPPPILPANRPTYPLLQQLLSFIKTFANK